MVCTIHPNRQAGSICEMCGQPFCDECLVEVSGKYYCKEHVAQLVKDNPGPRQYGPHRYENSRQQPYTGYQETQQSYVPPYPPGYIGYGYGHYPYKNRVIALLLCIFLGIGGFHRFYVGKIGTGLLYLFTGGLFGIGWIIDIICIAVGTFRDHYGYPLV